MFLRFPAPVGLNSFFWQQLRHKQQRLIAKSYFWILVSALLPLKISSMVIEGVLFYSERGNTKDRFILLVEPLSYYEASKSI